MKEIYGKCGTAPMSESCCNSVPVRRLKDLIVDNTNLTEAIKDKLFKLEAILLHVDPSDKACRDGLVTVQDIFEYQNESLTRTSNTLDRILEELL